MRVPIPVVLSFKFMGTPLEQAFTFFARWIVRHELFHDGEVPPPPAGYVSWSAYYDIVIRGGNPLTTFESPAGVPRGRKVSLVWTRAGEDVATIGMHFLHRDGPEVVDFTRDDSAALESDLNDLWDALKGYYDDSIALDRYTWHDFGVGVRKPNPAVRETVITAPVTGSDDHSELPAQVAVSVTFKTSARRNWGRVYLPAPTVQLTDADGRLGNAYVDAIRVAFGDFADAAASHQTPLVIWCPRHDGNLLQFFKRSADHPESAHELGLDNPDSSSFARTVDQVQVDDVPDVIRSRRVGKALHKATHSVT